MTHYHTSAVKSNGISLKRSVLCALTQTSPSSRVLHRVVIFHPVDITYKHQSHHFWRHYQLKYNILVPSALRSWMPACCENHHLSRNNFSNQKKRIILDMVRLRCNSNWCAKNSAQKHPVKFNENTIRVLLCSRFKHISLIFLRCFRFFKDDGESIFEQLFQPYWDTARRQYISIVTFFSSITSPGRSFLCSC